MFSGEAGIEHVTSFARGKLHACSVYLLRVLNSLSHNSVRLPLNIQEAIAAMQIVRFACNPITALLLGSIRKVIEFNISMESRQFRVNSAAFPLERGAVLALPPAGESAVISSPSPTEEPSSSWPECF
jgi:hypothetical protein